LARHAIRSFIPPVGESDASSAATPGLFDKIGAWQPLTGHGIARFAQSSWGRLFLVQALFALATTSTVIWCLLTAWIPEMEKSIASLPEANAGVQSGQLTWPGSEARLLTVSRLLSLAVDPTSSADLGQNGDLQLEFRGNDLRFRGILGQITVRYPVRWDLPLDRSGATALWGAWQWPVLTLLGISLWVAFVLVTLAIGLVLTPGIAIAVWTWGLNLTPGGAWKLGVAAFLPASLVFDAALMLYARHWMSLTSLAGALALSLLTGLFWTVCALPRLPRRPAREEVPNPFGNAVHTARAPGAAKPRNPFGS
jgi:hypothetical protein